MTGHVGKPASPVLAAGLGLRTGRGWLVRSASFRMNPPWAGQPVLGIAAQRPEAAAALIGLLAGRVRPSYGELRVLTADLTTRRGRMAVRGRVGVARGGGPRPLRRVAGLVRHAARQSRLRRGDRQLLAAAIVDRLALTAWADVPMRSAPELIVRRARLAAAAVHEPELLLLDGLLDGLTGRDVTALAQDLRTLSRDMAIVATGRQAGLLALACDEVITLGHGILVGCPAELPVGG